MMCLSYSLFGDPSSFEFGYYLRGCYLNMRMNQILYPEFHTIIYVTKELVGKYYGFFADMRNLNYQLTVQEEDNNTPRCEGMLRRMMPLFEKDFTHVVCRDLDSVSTFREANCVRDWLSRGHAFHAINDNDAHGGLMGGLVGFRSFDFKNDTGYTSFNQMIKGHDLSKHGSDQNFMNKYIHPKIKKDLHLHKIKGAGVEAAITDTQVPVIIERKFWTSDLISRYIGSAGVIDMELIRFFQSVDKNPKFDEFERKHKSICYWRQ